MLVTEEEAKEMWCPAARVPGKIIGVNNEIIGYASQNRGLQMDQPVYNCYCIASKCMWFRWGETAHWDKTEGRSPEESGAKTIRRGFCGMAGKP